MKNNNLRVFIIFSYLFFVTTFIAGAGDIFNYPEGSYSRNIYLSLSDVKNSDEIFYSFEKNNQSPDMPYQGGLFLSALEGEERQYTLNFLINGAVNTFHYTIDKRPPLSPEIEFINNENSYGYSFKQESPDTEIYYGFDNYKNNEVFLWKDELIPPPKTGSVFYFARDKAGNKSRLNLITPDKTEVSGGKTVLNVRSPVDGDFSNTQLLYIDRDGFEWIKYTLNGTDPVENGVEYSDPVEIRRYGSVKLLIAAKPENSGKIVFKEINYRVNTKAPLKNMPPSGIYSEGISLKKLSEGYKYCLDERSPSVEDRLFESDLNINPVYGGVKYSVIRINNPETEVSGDFRYFYIIDDRFPANPLINLESKLPYERKLDVTLRGPAYSDIYYTLDGSTPGRTSETYHGKFSIEIPENRNAGSIIIKARAVSLNGKTSGVVSRIYAYDTKKPEKHEVEIKKNPESGLLEIDYVLEPDEKLFYALQEPDGVEVQKNNFHEIDRKDFFLDIPEGYKKSFNFIFAVVDEAGNWSDYTGPLNVIIDKRIPSAAKVDFNGEIITITSDYNIAYKYEILRNGNIVISEEGDYSGPLKLDGPYFDSTLHISILLHDDSGNKFILERKYYLPLEKKEKEAVIFSRKSQDIYSGAKVDFYVYPDSLDEDIFYYLTEVLPDGNKETSGPFETDGHIVIDGIEGVKADYYLEVFSINKNSGEKSKINSYEFTIDNEKPGIPYITGLENNSVVNDRVVLRAENENDSIIFMNYSNDKEKIGQLFSHESIIFNKPLIFDVKEGDDKDFYIKLGAGDSAGNSAENPDIFHFRIDKKSPVITTPEIFLDENNILNVVYNNGEKLNYYYETGELGTQIPLPDENSKYFTEKLQLNRDNYKNKELLVKIKAADEAGNFSRHPFCFIYNFDSEAPTAYTPNYTVDYKNKKIFFYWDNPEENIFYTTANVVDAENKWVKYEYPFTLKYTSSEAKIILKYYFEDPSGNMSSIEEKTIALPATEQTEIVTGITNNTQYNRDLILKKKDTKSLVRYEISTDMVNPPAVTVFSPILPDSLPFKVEDGESIDFIVSMKEFNDDSDIVGGAEQVLRFSIDKQMPEPPEISGIKDGEYYLNNCTASFKPGTDVIFYSVRNKMDNENNFQEYKAPFLIDSPEGTYYSYIIEAYSRDLSGNKSSLKSWEITIDKEIIYVSGNGKDYYEGTRSKPFRTLNKALEHIKTSERKTIFIEEGNYVLQSPGVIDENVNIYGGFKKNNWQEKTGSTEIVIEGDFPEDNPAFYVYGGNLLFENIKFHITGAINSTVFYLNKGNLNISNSRLDMDCNDNSSLIDQHYGKLVISNTEITGKIGKIPFLSTEYGIVNINKCNFDITSDSQESIMIKAENSVDYSISSSDIDAASGANFTVIKTINSSMEVKAAKLKTSNNSVVSTVIESIGSKLNIIYTHINTEDTNRLSRGIVSEDSHIEFKGNTLAIDARTGAIGFSITGGNTVFYNNRINIADCNDFAYLYMLNGGKHQIETNIIKIGSADEIVQVRTRNAETGFFNNTVSFNAVKKSTIAFKPENGSTNRIINNIINISDTDSSGETSLLMVDDKSNMISIKNNCFYGWDSYSSGIEKAENLLKLDLVDNIYSGGRYSGNINEDPDITFFEEGNYKLSGESACIDSGYDLSNIIINKVDIDGETRPNRTTNSNPVFDIGVDEYYE